MAGYYHAYCLAIHGFGMALAVIIFSHSKNSTYLRQPVIAGRTMEVALLDTTSFVLFLLISTAASIATPFYIDQYHALPNGGTMFPTLLDTNRSVDYIRIAIEGGLMISVSGIVVYAFQRLICLMTWLKSGTAVLVGLLYLVAICLMPMFVATLVLDFPELRYDATIQIVASRLALASPIMAMALLFGEMGSRFPDDVTTASFYVIHGVLFLLGRLGIHRSGSRLRKEYLSGPSTEAQQ